MEAAVAAVAAIAVVATGLLKLAAATGALDARKHRDILAAAADKTIIAALYPGGPGAPIDDALPGNARAVEFSGTAKATLEVTIAAAAASNTAFLKIAQDLCALAPAANDALKTSTRAVAIASIVAAAQPLLYPEADQEDVYTAWYWHMATVYYEPSVAMINVPARVDIKLQPPLLRVIGAAM